MGDTSPSSNGFNTGSRIGRLEGRLEAVEGIVGRIDRNVAGIMETLAEKRGAEAVAAATEAKGEHKSDRKALWFSAIGGGVAVEAIHSLLGWFIGRS